MQGVFGFGLDIQEDQEAALRTCHALLQPNGWLVLGWITDLSADPAEMPFVRDHFEPVAGWRKTFVEFPIVTDVFSPGG
jgi:hypothetical protein